MCRHFTILVHLAIWSVAIGGGNATAQSFSVTPDSFGLLATDLLRDVSIAGESPSSIYNAESFSGTNVLDVPDAILGLPFTSPPNLNGLSTGREPIPLPGEDRMIWDLYFSVDRSTVGLPLTAVNIEAMANDEASHVYLSNPHFVGRNIIMPFNESLGLASPDERPVVDDLDALVLLDNRYDPEPPYPGFSNQANQIDLDLPHFSVDGSAAIFAGNTGSQFADLAVSGLASGDDVDALILNADNQRALFSLAPGSPSLTNAAFTVDLPGGGTRPAGPGDIFFTDFSGTIEIAGPGNVNYPVELIAENLGLLPTDNLDALDLTTGPTIASISDDPDVLAFFVANRMAIIDECFGNDCSEVVHAYSDTFDLDQLERDGELIVGPSVLANDLTLVRGFGDTALTAEIVEPPSQGEIVLEADGSFVYFPFDPLNPASDSFTYTAVGPLDSSTSTVTLVSQALPELDGDFNGNGQVEQGDLDLVLLSWGEEGTAPPTGWVSDLPNGLIDQGELDRVLLNWGSGRARLAAATVPEPTAAAIFGMLGIGVLFLKRRRSASRTPESMGNG